MTFFIHYTRYWIVNPLLLRCRKLAKCQIIAVKISDEVYLKTHKSVLLFKLYPANVVWRAATITSQRASYVVSKVKIPTYSLHTHFCLLLLPLTILLLWSFSGVNNSPFPCILKNEGFLVVWSKFPYSSGFVKSL